MTEYKEWQTMTHPHMGNDAVQRVTNNVTPSHASSHLHADKQSKLQLSRGRES